MHVQPQNIEERVFAITVVLLALVGFSYVVGSITGSLAQLRSMSNDGAQQFWNLRRFLKQNNVPGALSMRIQKYLEHQCNNQRATISLDSIKIIQLLSEQLFSELQCELSVRHLKVHPLFYQLSIISQISMHRLANSAISRKPLAHNDVFFVPGEYATHMSVVVNGHLSYVRVDSEGHEHPEDVSKGEDWISEPVLWARAWVHLGLLVAVKETDLLLVDPRKFGEVISLNPVAHSLARTYARNFLHWLNTRQRDTISDIWQGEDVGPTIRSFMEKGVFDEPE